jgi:acetyl-CoA carboxylase carboxyltransferase component
MSWDKHINEIKQRRIAAKAQGGKDAVARQHDKGRLTIRERIDALLDPHSFKEVGPIAGRGELNDDGSLASFTPGNFVLGLGKIDGRNCIVGGEDFTMSGGSPNAAGLRKSVYTEELACQYRIPLIRLHEGSGGSVAGSAGKGGPPSLPEPVFAGHRFASVARTLAMVPVAAAALGSVAGLPAVRLVASHYCVMARHTAQVLAGGPALVERALGESVTKDELGGAELHERSGVVDDIVEDEAEAFSTIRKFLSYLPQNVWQLPPVVATDDKRDREDEKLSSIVPANRRQIYDMRRVIASVLDEGSFFEMTRRYGPSLITGLGRLMGVPVAIFANDCKHLAGAMTAAAARKMRRFVEFAQVFHLPVISLVDEPGFMIGPDAEREGTVRAGASAVLAAATCTVPWASVIVRKSVGLAAGAHYGPSAYVLSWPSAESGALPVEGGVAVAFAREIAAHPDPIARRAELEHQFAARQSPFPRAEAFSIHDLIDPKETRTKLCDWIELVSPQLQHLLGPTHFTYRP